MLTELYVILLAFLFHFLYNFQYVLIFPVSLLTIFFNHLIFKREEPCWYIVTFIKKTQNL